ncbi:hypothetical protein O6H91_15G036200 [Diphasiastrum complanatum]|uniref:Uncharacterized protein n=1 Tax=Diphasiastrum complanatum TaxID=34168 RepID=A0ACC2BHD8_DIPCM|nr:hypothetical protein O6H91_15G036200 [Diphasiastrum complanatum]
MARNTVVGNISSFVGNALGGVRGWNNLAAWAVAGTVAYYLWIKPEREAQREREERAALRRENDRYPDVEKVWPRPDPQDTGLIRGKVKDPK